MVTFLKRRTAKSGKKAQNVKNLAFFKTPVKFDMGKSSLSAYYFVLKLFCCRHFDQNLGS
jgi:hypothetical protein